MSHILLQGTKVVVGTLEAIAIDFFHFQIYGTWDT